MTSIAKRILNDEWRLAEFQQADFVSRQGEPPSSLSMLLDGSLVVVRNFNEARPSEESILAKGVQVGMIEEPGTIFGEKGLVLGQRAVSIVCFSARARVAQIPIPEEGWAPVLERNTPLCVELCHLLAEHTYDMSMKANQSSGFAERVNQAVKHFDQELEDLLAKTDALIKKRSMSELNPEMRLIGDALRELHNRPRHGMLEEATIVDRKQGRPEPRDRPDGPRELVLQPGEVLMGEGEAGTTMYLLVSGLLEAIVGGRVVGQIRPDEFIGTVAPLRRSVTKRSATVRAAEVSELVRVCASVEEFHALAEQNGWLPTALAQDLAQRMRTYNKLLTDIGNRLTTQVNRLAGGWDTYDALFDALSRMLAKQAPFAELSQRARTCATRVIEVRNNFHGELTKNLASFAP